MAARLPKGSQTLPLFPSHVPGEDRPLGVHLVASIDADLYQELVRYCTARGIPLSRAVNNALSRYFTGQDRSMAARRRTGTPDPPALTPNPNARKVPLSVHIDVDLVVLAEEYCATHRVYLSSVVNRALALWLHAQGDRSKGQDG